MKILSHIFYLSLLCALIVILIKLNKSLQKSRSDFNMLQQTLYNLHAAEHDLKNDINFKNDYIMQFSQNHDFIDQMIRQKTGNIKAGEIIYKFEEK